MQPFARGDVNDPRIRRRYRDSTDRLRGLRIEDRYPGAPIVIGFPHSAIDHSGQKRVRLARHAGDRTRAATPEWTHQAPLHVLDNRGSADFREGELRQSKGQEDGDKVSIKANRLHGLFAPSPLLAGGTAAAAGIAGPGATPDKTPAWVPRGIASVQGLDPVDPDLLHAGRELVGLFVGRMILY